MSDKPAAETTLGDRVEAALKAAGEQAMRNSNMGQIQSYRINHVISLIEREVSDAARYRRALEAIAAGEGEAQVIARQELDHAEG